jgi:hypothetical protein
MAGTPKLLAQFTPTASDSQLAVVPSGKRWVISMVHAANVDTVQRTFRLNHVQSGGSSTATNRIAPDIAIPAADMVEFFGGAVMAAGDELRGLSDVTSIIAVSVYGLEETV